MKNSLTIVFTFITLYCFGQDFNAFRIGDPDIGAFAVGDFNGDGYADIIGIEFKAGNVASIHLFTNNKGNPISFTRSLIVQNTSFTGRPEPIDLDGDGDLDMIYTSHADLSINALINDGNGVFTTTPLGVSGALLFRVADIDKDGDSDIVGMSFNPRRIYIYTNNGGLTFSSETIYNTTRSLTSIDVADFDNDGNIDILAGFNASSDEQVSIFQNNGNGSFIKKDIVLDDFGFLINVYAADINKDGNIDILATSTSNGARIWENQGSLTFEKKEMDTPGITYVTGASVADLTGEGQPDIILGTNKEFQWYKNISLVDYTYEQKVMNGVTGAFDIISVDLNNDGAIDVITSNGSLWWYQNMITQAPSGVSDAKIKDYQIMPNPVSGEFLIKDLNGEGNTLIIYNQLGQQILITALTDGKADVQSLPSGQYTFMIIGANGNIIGKSSVVKN